MHGKHAIILLPDILFFSIYGLPQIVDYTIIYLLCNKKSPVYISIVSFGLLK